MIENAVNRVTYKGDGITTEFAIPFEFIDKEDIVVVVVDPDKNESVLTSDYFIDEEKRQLRIRGIPSAKNRRKRNGRPFYRPAGAWSYTAISKSRRRARWGTHGPSTSLKRPWTSSP